MTQVASNYLGNTERDPKLSKQVLQAKNEQTILEVTLTQSDRHKGRILTQTKSGAKIGIITNRQHTLTTGDVFATDSNNLVLVNLTAESLMVLKFEQPLSEISGEKLLLLGHLLGNHHYPLKIQKQKVYVRPTGDPRVIIQQINELDISGLTVSTEQIQMPEISAQPTHHH